MHCPSISDHFQVPCHHLADWWLQTWAETAQSEPFKAKNTNVSQTRQLQKLEAGHKWGRQTETTARGDWAYLYKRPKENPEPTQNRTALTTTRLEIRGAKEQWRMWKSNSTKTRAERKFTTSELSNALRPEAPVSQRGHTPNNALSLSPTCYTCRGVMGVNYLQKPEMFAYQAVNTHRCLCWTLEKLQV